MERLSRRNTPQLRVAVTPHCNLRCIYCRPGGEGYSDHLDVFLSWEEIISIIILCAKVGFTHIKFTGGEPLLRPDLRRIIEGTREIDSIEEIQIVTNGTLLRGRVAELKAAGVDWITISLDSAEPASCWRIRGASLSEIVSGISECSRQGLPVRLNMVVMRSNLDQINTMVRLASELGCSLKLLDLICLDADKGLKFWQKEYLHFDTVRNVLETLGAAWVGLEEAPGGIGAPLSEYRMDSGLQVVIKDSTRGTYYHKSCKKCKNYPCQDALISVRVTHDGCLKRCLIRNDNLVPLLPVVRAGCSEEALVAIQEAFSIMRESEYQPFAWDPFTLLRKSSDE